MNYSETLAYLYAKLPFFQKQGEKAYKPKLTNIIKLCEYLGNPQDSFKCIHVAGTNGKGSSSHFLASILQESGYKTGLYTSPHLKDFRERFRINGELCKPEFIVHFVAHIKPIIEEIEPSFFEVSVALAFELFKKEKVDIAVIEVGLGGLWDSTNIISPIACLITNIGLDHVHILGSSLEEIAYQKAGIIKYNTPVVVSEYREETYPVFIEQAKHKQAPLRFAQDEIEILSFSENKANSAEINLVYKKRSYSFESELKGSYQSSNIRGVFLLVEVLKDLGLRISNYDFKEGLKYVIKNTSLKGRWQVLQENPTIICDTGHNAHALNITINKLKTLRKKTLRLVLGFVNDKDINEAFKLLPSKAEYYFCVFDNFRATDLISLKNMAIKYKLKYSLYQNVNEAIISAKKDSHNEDIIFVGGSTFVVAEIENL
jgi:dihydrofolate synthase / folylpolyglutamate synthase